MKLIRLDERLIHGQVAYSWARGYSIDLIVVVTGKSKTEFEQTMLRMACPKDIECIFYSFDDELFPQEDLDNQNVLIVTDDLNNIIRLMEQGVEVKSVNIGGIYHKQGREKFIGTLYIDETIRENMKLLLDQGVELEHRLTPNDNKVFITHDKL